jgi:prophage regulatory protein
MTKQIDPLGLIHLIRKPEVLRATGRCKSQLAEDIHNGYFVPPVNIGARAIAWPVDEVNEIQRARIAGYSQVEIKHLVKKLVENRTAEHGGS